MGTRQNMTKLLGRWFELTCAEAGAIQSAAWPALKEIQADKLRLQESITQDREKWMVENPRGAAGGPFRAEVDKLLSLEARNAELLAGQLRKVRSEKESLDRAFRNLRKIHRSYVRNPETVWHCYS